MTTGATPSSAPRPKRSRARRIVPLCLAAWLVLEIWLLILVADAAGGLTVFLLLLAGVLLGGAVVKRAGRRAMRGLSEMVNAQQSGAPPLVSGRSEGNALAMLAGLLLILPGLLSDIAGLLLLVPPVRKALGGAAERAMERRMNKATVGGLHDTIRQARIHRPDGKVVQGEVIRDDAPSGPHHEAGPRPPLRP
ncbi:FxsA family protein [Streptomyces sp. NA04227]|uniref:FxsA family membrane protein n=1 Tax=Streptomyces sp. NA04227 TaxID=2742136 RepID=UPI00159051D3|nr:FxsA family membrane protein [Streptomyces sp. NA04227]QKW05438.1 FxsA family protein [Streptomyces sp. NA04227]